jgi:hypothetical protein
MNPADYRPVYDSGVVEYGPNPNFPVTQINPAYCLMAASAVVLADLFTATEVGKPKIYTAAPVGQAPGSPFSFNHLVPWFEFKNGARLNAGQLATCWGLPGLPYASALGYAVSYVNSPVEG